jgi:thiol-disulfide isomerase/thioredoxin
LAIRLTFCGFVNKRYTAPGLAFIAGVFFACFLFLAQALAGETHAGGVVRPAELSEIDAVIAEPENRLFVVMLASWCGPCVAELPVLNRLYGKYKDKGFSIVGLSVEAGGPSVIQPLIDKYRVRFPVFWVGEKALAHFDVTGIPHILVVRNGRVVDRIRGKTPPDFLTQRIRKLLR